jgi:hypothetical protein
MTLHTKVHGHRHNDLPLNDFETTLFIEGPKEEFNLLAKK